MAKEKKRTGDDAEHYRARLREAARESQAISPQVKKALADRGIPTTTLTAAVAGEEAGADLVEEEASQRGGKRTSSQKKG